MWNLETIIKINNRGRSIRNKDLIENENKFDLKLLDDVINDLENTFNMIQKSHTEVTPLNMLHSTDKILELDEGERFMVLSPVVRGKKGRHEKVIADARKNGYVRLRIDGTIYDISEDIELELTKKHNIDIVIDRGAR